MPRKAKIQAQAILSGFAEAEKESEFCSSVHGAPDEQRTLRWLHLKGKDPTPAQKAKQLLNNSCRPKAISPPFLNKNDDVVFELQWYGYKDVDATLHGTEYIAEVFGMDDVLVMFIDYWAHNPLVSKTVVRALRDHFGRLPVDRLSPSLSLCSPCHPWEAGLQERRHCDCEVRVPPEAGRQPAGLPPVHR